MKTEKIPLDVRSYRERRQRLGLTPNDVADALRVKPSRAFLLDYDGAQLYPEQLYFLSKLLRCRMSDLIPGYYKEEWLCQPQS